MSNFEGLTSSPKEDECFCCGQDDLYKAIFDEMQQNPQLMFREVYEYGRHLVVPRCGLCGSNNPRTSSKSTSDNRQCSNGRRRLHKSLLLCRKQVLDRIDGLGFEYEYQNEYYQQEHNRRLGYPERFTRDNYIYPYDVNRGSNLVTPPNSPVIPIAVDESAEDYYSSAESEGPIFDDAATRYSDYDMDPIDEEAENCESMLMLFFTPFEMQRLEAAILQDYSTLPEADQALIARAVQLACEHELEITAYFSQVFNYEYQSDDFVRAAHAILINPDTRYVVKIIEDVLLFVRYLITSNSKIDYLFAVTTFAKLRLGNEPLLLNGMVVQLLDYIRGVFIINPEYQSEDSFLDSLRNMREMLDKYESVKDSALCKKLYKVAMYALSLSLFKSVGIDFDTLGYKQLEAEAIRREYHLGPNFVFCIMETTLFIVERGYQSLKMGSITPLFHCSRTYEEWYDLTQKLVNEAPLMINPEIHGLNEFKFRDELDIALEKGSSIQKYAFQLEAPEKKLVASIMGKLYMIKNDMVSRVAAREAREAPFSIMIYGDSSIGKSSLIEMLFAHFGKIRDLPIDSTYKYTRNAAAKFWDGFVTSQWCIVLDDIAAEHPNKAQGGDDSLKEIIQICNGVPFCPDQAELEMKGKTPVRAKMVIATSNIRDLHAKEYYTCPSAIQRRFPYVITPKVKPEYLVNGSTTQLDSSKVPEFSGYPDIWTFKIEKIIPVPIQAHYQNNPPARREVLKTPDGFSEFSLMEFLVWFNKAIDQHFRNQSIVRDSLKKMVDTKLCPDCRLPDCACEVEIELQADGDEPNIDPWAPRPELGDLCLYAHYLVTGFEVFTVNVLGYWLANVGIIFYVLFLTCDVWILKTPLGWLFSNDTIGVRARLTEALFRAAEDRPWLAKYLLRCLGSVVANRYQLPYRFTRIAACLTIALTFKMVMQYLLSMFCSKEEQNSGPEITSVKEGIRPEPASEERQNVWYKNQYVLSPFDFTKESIGAKASSFEDFITKVHKQCVKFHYLDGNGLKLAGNGALCIKGNLYITNYHAIPKLDTFVLRYLRMPNKDGVNENVDILVNRLEFIRIEGSDLAFIELKQVAPLRDLSKYLLPKIVGGTWDGALVGFDKEICKSVNHCRNIKLSDGNWIKDVTCQHFTYNPQVDTQKGDCGQVLIANCAQGYVILGLHYAANTGISKMINSSMGATVPLSQETLKNVLDIKPQFVMQGYVNMEKDGRQLQLTDLHHKSPIRYIEQGVAKVYGTYVGPMARSRSTVKRSLAFDYMRSFGYVEKFTKPMMRGWLPKRKTLLEIFEQKELISAPILEVCTKSFINSILKRLEPDQLEQLGTLDWFTTVNGAAGVAYIDGINRNTSMGFPWNKSKKFFLQPIAAEGQNMHPVDFDDYVKSRVQDMWDRMGQGERVHPVFTASLKDEPISFAKAESGATRVFAAAPVDWSLIVRKLFLTQIRLIQNNKFIFECGAGTVAQSVEWHKFYIYLTHFGKDRMVAGDYSKFDKRMVAILIKSAFDILIAVAIASKKYSDEDILRMRVVACDVSHHLINYFGDFMELIGNPSGQPLTVIINSLVNSLYMRLVYFHLNPEHEVDSFSDNVHLMTYGDDNIMGVHPDCSWFNHTAISQVLSAFGVKYTMAEKDRESVPFINIRECTFLKRCWRYNEETTHYMAALDEDSIIKSLMTIVPSKSISEEAQMAEIIKSAMMEYFFYGREKYNERREFFQRMIVELDLEIYFADQPLQTFDSWLESYRIQSKMNKDLARQMRSISGFQDQSRNQTDLTRTQLLTTPSDTTEV